MSTTISDYHRIHVRRPPKIHQGIDGFTNKLIGLHARRKSLLKAIQVQAEKVEAERLTLQSLTEEQFQEQLTTIRVSFRSRAKLPQPPINAGLAITCEISRRVLGLTPHLVQIMGALAMAKGYLAEMATGEGKTLTVCLWAGAAGWSGFPCHVITSNDYLASRDAEKMAGFYQRCGLSIGSVTSEMGPAERRQGYAKDIVYTTSKELLADFLKDRLTLGQSHDSSRRLIQYLADPVSSTSDDLLLRGIHTAIVDEADNVLIDEAVTPLVISRPYKNPELCDAYSKASHLARQMQAGVHYDLLTKTQEIRLKEEGWTMLETAREGFPSLWKGTARAQELIEQSLQAKEFFINQKNYVITDNKVSIVDGFSGRLMADRSWSQGLHQAIEAKEGVPLSDPTETMTSLSFQRFFRFFIRLCGLSGTAAESADELWQIYRLPVLRIPTHKPIIRIEQPDKIFATAEAKWKHLREIIVNYNRSNKAILVGTQAVGDSEHVASLLKEEGLNFQLLNAVKSGNEAEIIEKAGQAGTITIATNMAGRGTDIKLGPGVSQTGGLHVICTERSEARRIDRQLFGRAGRHGDPGHVDSLICLEDAVAIHFIPSLLRKGLIQLEKYSGCALQAVSLFIYRMAQKKAEKNSHFHRQMVIKADTAKEGALSFSGGIQPY